MNDNGKIIVKKRGEDGNRIISIRIKENTLAKIDALANSAGYSRNELINLFIEYGADHCELI
ncbi:MAG: ribbon-helix-helix protein, CopG family [Clostridiales bacterium]|nr:ribbon-helix-helix protein, CopG family [Candidatus Crickella caballi]